jgi:hypothetical protein
MLTGNCLCGTVRFELHGKPGPFAYCHCTMCQRASGSAFGANVPVRARYLKWVSGLESIAEYESSPGKFRAFCRSCGSPVYSRRDAEPDSFRIRLGTLNGDPERRAFGHFWVASKAAWFEIADALPQYPEGSVTDSVADDD